MSKKSFFLRVKHFFRPPTETYESRQARPGDPGPEPATQNYGATEQRRNMGFNGAG